MCIFFLYLVPQLVNQENTTLKIHRSLFTTRGPMHKNRPYFPRLLSPASFWQDFGIKDVWSNCYPYIIIDCKIGKTLKARRQFLIHLKSKLNKLE